MMIFVIDCHDAHRALVARCAVAAATTMSGGAERGCFLPKLEAVFPSIWATVRIFWCVEAGRAAASARARRSRPEKKKEPLELRTGGIMKDQVSNLLDHLGGCCRT
jgi:hypothetical protein